MLLLFQKQRLFPLPATYTIIAKFSLILDQVLMVILAKDAEKSTHQESHQHETMARRKLFFLTLSLDECNLIFFRTGPTDLIFAKSK